MTTGIGLILKAAVFAADKHRGQVRKGAEGAPYIQHPIAVALALAEEGGVTDPELIAAGLLHDTIEDTPTVHDDLAESFGDRVAGLVAELTDDKRLPKQVRKQRQVEHARHLTPGARQVKLADKLCNLREIQESPPVGWSSERLAAYFDWSKTIVDQIRDSNLELARQFDLAHAKANFRN